MARYINPTTQYFDASGQPLANGKLWFYDSGTNDDKATYADVNETIPNTQPLVLTGDGRVPNCFYGGAAKVVLVDKDDQQLWERDPVFVSESSAFGAPYDSVTIYGKNDVVTFNDLLYVSLTDPNQNNTPASSPANWTQFDLVKRWNANETYGAREPVIYTDFIMYISLTASNLNNIPDVSPLDWQPVGGATSGGVFADWDLSIDYGVGANNIVVGSDGNYYVSLLTPNLNQDPISSPTFWKKIKFIESDSDGESVNFSVSGTTLTITNLV
jgi:hypothetical protein